MFVFASQVSEVRRSTRMEKKKLAMAMREKQLGALGMQVPEFSLLYDIHCFSYGLGESSDLRTDAFFFYSHRGLLSLKTSCICTEKSF